MLTALLPLLSITQVVRVMAGKYALGSNQEDKSPRPKNIPLFFVQFLDF